MQLGLNSTYSCFLPRSQGASGKEKFWLVIAVAKPPLPPPATLEPSGTVLDWGPGRPDPPSTLGLGSLGPCPQPTSGSGDMGHFQAQNCNQTVLSFHSAMWIATTLVPVRVAVSGGQTSSINPCHPRVCLGISGTQLLWTSILFPAHWPHQLCGCGWVPHPPWAPVFCLSETGSG